MKMPKNEELLQSIPVNHRLIAASLLDEMRFMKITLEQLKKDVTDVGYLDNWSNGNQSCRRENPALKSYNSTLTKYVTVANKLLNMIPPENQTEDQLSKFIEAFED